MSKRLNDKNRFTVAFPELVSEWNYNKNLDVNPEDVSYGMRKKVWWICKKGHEWETTLNSRCGKSKRGCPYCGGKFVSDENRLSVRKPEILKIWCYKKNKLTPNDFSYGSDKRAWFVCAKGHEWETPIYAVAGCPYCSNQKTNESNCFKNTQKVLMEEWDYSKNKMSPEDIPSNSNKSVFWICKHGHGWLDSINHRVHGRNCPYCSNHRVTKETCLQSRAMEVSLEWDYSKNVGLSPDTVAFSSSKKIWWKCKNCSHEWNTAVANRTVGGTACPKCARKVKLKDGSQFDSFVEAYLYLKLKSKGFKIEQHKLYGFGKFKCDFYLPERKTYIEVTAFNKDMAGNRKKAWVKYYDKILRKKKYTEEVLKCEFRFIQRVLNNKQRNFVRKFVL
ncbi:MAG: zinc-ribbon domain-containing protein [bacterium]|nr:zinc-ribbon domain-containing protein [bacterium]